MKKIVLFAAVAILAVSGTAYANNDDSVGYNQTHPANPSSLIPSAFEKQLPAEAAEVIVANMQRGD